jgi:hypothetical protein
MVELVPPEPDLRCERYREVPTFGRDTIRKFSSNSSEMKKMAARDFEDILQVCLIYLCMIYWRLIIDQCAIPVFDGLLPEPHNTVVLRLIFLCCHWHGLAKLRMHTDHTLMILNATTSYLGQEFRAFVDTTCSAFDTRELDREVNARRRREAKKSSTDTNTTTSRRRKRFNLDTYKFHSLGDYVATIEMYGTCDSYTTEVVSASETTCTWQIIAYLLSDL